MSYIGAQGALLKLIFNGEVQLNLFLKEILKSSALVKLPSERDKFNPTRPQRTEGLFDPNKTRSFIESIFVANTRLIVLTMENYLCCKFALITFSEQNRLFVFVSFYRHYWIELNKHGQTMAATFSRALCSSQNSIGRKGYYFLQEKNIFPSSLCLVSSILCWIWQPGSLCQSCTWVLIGTQNVVVSLKLLEV